MIFIISSFHCYFWDTDTQVHQDRQTDRQTGTERQTHRYIETDTVTERLVNGKS